MSPTDFDNHRTDAEKWQAYRKAKKHSFVTADESNDETRSGVVMTTGGTKGAILPRESSEIRPFRGEKSQLIGD